jgi:hypothetical protein
MENDPPDDDKVGRAAETTAERGSNLRAIASGPPAVGGRLGHERNGCW